MKKKSKLYSKVGTEIIFISTAVATFYFLFQYLVIHTSIALNGECLFTFWLSGENRYLTPYALVLEAVILFVAFGIASVINRISIYKKLSFIESAYYCLLIIVLALWLNGLHGMWNTFEYEKGNLSIDEYYGTETDLLIGPWDIKQCKTST